MSILLHGDCLEEMKGVDDNSVDFIFCDLPYGQTSCKWDVIIPWEPFWKEILRIKKLNTPIFFTTTTKFGVELINNAPKKCPFRYDLVWVKSAPAGFLSAKKMPMRKHEMVYVFYEKLPFYDLSSHTHKFIKPNTPMGDKPDIYGRLWDKNGNPYVKEKQHSQYDPPLPVSVVKEEEDLDEKYKNKGGLYSKVSRNGLLKAEPHYDPPLPVSVVKEVKSENNYHNQKVHHYTDENGKRLKEDCQGSKYDPPLPVSVIKDGAINEEYEGLYGGLKAPDYVCNNIERNELRRKYKKEGKSESAYDPPLPTTMLEIKSTRGKHSTEKPVALMEWILKYFSKEGDVVLDPTMGSGSTGVACKNMNRNFIGIEKDPEIYEVAVNRIDN